MYYIYKPYQKNLVHNGFSVNASLFWLLTSLVRLPRRKAWTEDHIRAYYNQWRLWLMAACINSFKGEECGQKRARETESWKTLKWSEKAEELGLSKINWKGKVSDIEEPEKKRGCLAIYLREKSILRRRRSLQHEMLHKSSSEVSSEESIHWTWKRGDCLWT